MIFMHSRFYEKLDGREAGMFGVLTEVGLLENQDGVDEVRRVFLKGGQHKVLHVHHLL